MTTKEQKPELSVNYIGGWYDGPLDFMGYLKATKEPIVGFIRNDWDGEGEDAEVVRDFFVYKHVSKVVDEEIQSTMVLIGIYTYDEIESWPSRY